MKGRALLAAAAMSAVMLTQQAILGGEKKEDPFAKFPKPGPEHKLLAGFQGAWTCNVKSWFGPGEPKESKGTMARTMIMDGRYLQEKFTGDFLGMKFQGMGLMGYDANKKKYVSAWIDNFGTGISTMQGSYDAEAKSITMLGEEDNPTMGGKMKTRDVLTIVDQDEQKLEMYRTPLKSGKEHKVMEITFKRK